MTRFLADNKISLSDDLKRYRYLDDSIRVKPQDGVPGRTAPRFECSQACHHAGHKASGPDTSNALPIDRLGSDEPFCFSISRRFALADFSRQ